MAYRSLLLFMVRAHGNTAQGSPRSDRVSSLPAPRVCLPAQGCQGSKMPPAVSDDDMDVSKHGADAMPWASDAAPDKPFDYGETDDAASKASDEIPTDA